MQERKITVAVCNTQIFGSEVAREDKYVETLGAKVTDVHHFITTTAEHAYNNNGVLGVRATHVAAILNDMMQEHFKYMPFRVRQLGTQVVYDSPYEISATHDQSGCPRSASNGLFVASRGYKLVLNAAREPNRQHNYMAQAFTRNEQQHRQHWLLTCNVAVSTKNLVLISHASISCTDDPALPTINVWVGQKTDRERFEKTLRSME